MRLAERGRESLIRCHVPNSARNHFKKGSIYFFFFYNKHRDGQFYIIYESRQSKVMDLSHVKMKTFKI